MSAVNDFTSICPADCSTDLVFPAAVTDPDCLSYDTFKSQIGDFILRPTGAANPFGTSWTGEGATITVEANTVDNTGTDNTTSRRLAGVGSLGEFEYSVRETRYGEDVIIEGVAPFEFTVDNVDQTNRTFAKALQCQPSNFTCYLGTEDHLFGLSDGMKLRNLRVQLPLPGGREDIQTIIIRADVVTSRTSPERTANNPFV
ncbi:MAG: hypothetical protein AAFO91_01300 [Bacteroidota bacterium]